MTQLPAGTFRASPWREWRNSSSHILGIERTRRHLINLLRLLRPSTGRKACSEVVCAMIIRHALPRLHQPRRTCTYHSSKLCRAYATTQLSNGITIAYDLHEPPKEKARENAAPILFIHGLFGSKANNRSVSKYALHLSPLCIEARPNARTEHLFAT